MSLFVDPEWIRKQLLTPREQRAWKLYCEETSGRLDVRDFWEELPFQVQKIYLEKAVKQD